MRCQDVKRAAARGFSREGRGARRSKRAPGRHLDALEARRLMAATDVVINEIMFNSATFETADEYVELYNKGTTPVSLNGWKISRGIDYTFGNVTINAGQHLAVAANLTRFGQKYPGVLNVVGPWTGALSNSKNTIEISDNLGNEIDSVQYADDGEWAVRRRGGLDARKVAGITRSGTTATVTLNAHGLANGRRVAIFGADQSSYNGIFQIAGVTANTFTITVNGSPASPGTGEIYLRGSDVNHFGWDWFNPADGMGKSLELINPNLSNNRGQNWAPSGPDNGTPGAANSAAASNIAPMISDLSHFPVIPKSNQTVTVTAKITDELTSGVNVDLLWRRDGATSFATLDMLDDGAHGDGAAGDDIYGATIPAQTNGAVVEFYVRAADSGNRSRTLPGPTDVDGRQLANALYQVDDADYTGTQPLFKIIMTAAEKTELDTIRLGGDGNSNAQMNGTFISIDGNGIDYRYSAGFRNRGGGSRFADIANYRVNFTEANPWHNVARININGIYSASEVAASAIMSRAGVQAQWATPVKLRVNNVNSATNGSIDGMYGSYSWVEAEDNEMVESHFPLDPDGNYYRGIDGGHQATLAYLGTSGSNLATYRRLYPKVTNVEEDDYSDLIELTRLLSATNSATYVNDVLAHVDVAQWMRYLALNKLVGNNETSIGSNGRGDDFAMYRGVIDPRFKLIGHDLDTILSLGETQQAAITGLNNLFFTSGPGTTGSNSAAMNNFMRHPAFVGVYYQQIRELATTVFTPDVLGPLLRHALGGYLTAAQVQAAVDHGVSRAQAALGVVPHSPLVITTPPPTVTVAADLSLAGAANAADTRAITVNGMAAVWNARLGTWTFDNDGNAAGLQPGINRVLIAALDSSNNELERAAIDVVFNDGSTAVKNGPITTNTTWTAAGGPYVINGDVTVNSGVTLTIEPGTTVYFQSGRRLVVNGRLLADGAANNRIRFTREPGATGYWQGITFGNTGSANRISFADVAYAGSNTAKVATIINGSRVDLDNVQWSNVLAGSAVINITGNNNSLRLTNSTLPTITNNETLRFGGTIAATGYAVIQNNWFGTTTGHNDIIDWTGGNRNGTNLVILQILDNFFSGAGTGFTEADDILDLDGTDAHIEGNVFMNVYPSSTADTNSAISGGADGTNTANTSEIVSIRNFFYNVDHAFLMKEGNSVASVNDTFVKVLTGVFNFDEPTFAASPGRGGYVENAVFHDIVESGGLPVILQNPPTGSFIVRNSIAQGSSVYPGTGNVLGDPKLVNTANVTDPRIDFQLLPHSPAFGKGATIPAGAIITGEPFTPSPKNSATINVGPSNIWAYRWKLDNGSYGAEIPVSNPGSAGAVIPSINLTNLSNGTHQVSVIVKNSAGQWQSMSSATTSRVWQVVPAPRVRINEILADNDNTLQIGNDSPDVIELYNDSTATLDLSDMSISDDPVNPRRFVFPAGTTLAAGQYLLLYADSESGGGIHLGFGLSDTGDGVYLYNKPANGGTLMDSVTFGTQLEDLSIGRVNPSGAWALTTPTLGAANGNALPLGDVTKLKINEWLTDGVEPFSDDFIEIYNADTLPLNLDGLLVTDRFIDGKTKHAIAPLSFMRAGDYLELKADENLSAGADHLGFRLDHNRGEIALHTADQKLVDYVFYSDQRQGVSEGLPTDPGAPDYVFFSQPSPGVANASTNVTNVALRIVETAYNPTGSTGVDGQDYEFIEVMNTGATPINLAGYHFEAGINFSFGSMTLAPNQRTVIVRNLDAFTSRYGTGINVAGQFTEELDNNGENIRLLDSNDLVIQDFFYSNTWHQETDGNGATLVINSATAPLDAWSTAEGWHASTAILGTPGGAESAIAPGAVVINELLANSTGANDWIELRNTTGAPINIGGWYLSDSDGKLAKFQIPANTNIPANGFVVFTEAQFGGVNGFSLSSYGDDVYLSSATGGALTGYRDGVRFGASDLGVTFGRHLISTGANRFVAMNSSTQGTANTAPRVGPVIITEIMFNPVEGGDEYLEIKNTSAAAVQLFDPANPSNTWTLAGGVDFTFPGGQTLAAGEIALIVSIDPAAFRGKYGIPANVKIFGPWLGALSNGGERIEISKPLPPAPDLSIPYVVIDGIEYGDAAPWPIDADGNGPSLERFSEAQFGDDPQNWRANSVSGTPGAANTGSALTAAAQFVRTSAHKLVVQFSRNVQASLSTADLTLTNLGTGAVIATTLSYDVNTNTATFTFSGVPNGRLPNGRYRAVLNGQGINDAQNVKLDGNGDGTPGDNYTFNFHHLAGDINGDAAVNFADFQLLERNFGQPGATWEMGDLNYDGQINNADFNLLYSAFGSTLPAAAAPLPAATSMKKPDTVTVFAGTKIAKKRSDLLN